MRDTNQSTSAALDLEDPRSRANTVVARSVARLMSIHHAEIATAFSRPLFPLLSESALQSIRECIVEPVRSISDRGGKGWRSNLMLSACEALAGDSRSLEPWLGVI